MAVFSCQLCGEWKGHTKDRLDNHLKKSHNIQRDYERKRLIREWLSANPLPKEPRAVCPYCKVEYSAKYLRFDHMKTCPKKPACGTTAEATSSCGGTFTGTPQLEVTKVNSGTGVSTANDPEPAFDDLDDE